MTTEPSTITFRLEPGLLDKVSALAERLHRSLDDLGNEALWSLFATYLRAENEKIVAKVVKGALARQRLAEGKSNTREPIGFIERLRRENAVNNGKAFYALHDLDEEPSEPDPQLEAIKDAIDAKFVSGELTSEEWIKQLMDAVEEYYGEKLFIRAED